MEAKKSYFELFINITIVIGATSVNKIELSRQNLYLFYLTYSKPFNRNNPKMVFMRKIIFIDPSETKMFDSNYDNNVNTH